MIKYPDFDAQLYKSINTDLMNMSDEEATQHYILYGAEEGRIYKFDLPSGFDANIYKILNVDLQNMSDIEAMGHYSAAGAKEGRRWKDDYFDKKVFCDLNGYNLDDPDLYNKYVSDIRQDKNAVFEGIIKKYEPKYVFLVNHDKSTYGANHYLYFLYQSLQNRYPQLTFKLLEIEYQEELKSKYNITKEEVFEYYNDPTMLYKLVQRFKPLQIYLNSCNLSMCEIIKFAPRQNIILHSHEIYEHYLLATKLVPDYVVSERIAQQYLDNGHFTKPKVQPPALTDIEGIFQLSKEPITNPITNSYGTIDLNRITIGMCGQLSDRKNFKLFADIAKVFPQHNFLWIGGKASEAMCFNECNNVYHVPLTSNPYKYYSQILDYFVLFSKIDPCPFVVLENILLETRIIAFKDNIYTDHKHELTREFYFEEPTAISFQSCKKAINAIVNGKKRDQRSGNGLKYIETYFKDPEEVYRIMDLISK